MIDLLLFFINMTKEPIWNLILRREISTCIRKGGTFDQTNSLFNAINIRINSHVRNHEIKSTSIYICLLLGDWKAS